MTTAEKELLELLKTRSFQTGTFRLASGDTSSYYIDGRMTEVYSRGAALIGDVLYERTCDLAIDALGGLEVGAVPLSTAAVISYHRHGRSMEGFWVRAKLKDHGTQKLIEGGLKPSSRVVIVDDVVTRATSTVQAIKAVREIGCTIVHAIALVDRLQGARELLLEHGVSEYHPVFTIRDLGVKPD